MKTTLQAVILVLACAGTAAAEPHWQTRDRDAGDWHIESGVAIKVDALGHDTAKIVSPGYATIDIDGQRLDRELGNVRLSLGIFSKYLHFEGQPYAQVPHGWFHVSTAGLELWLMFPATDWLRVGLYHHSAHNFSDGTYGEGLELDAGMFDLRMLEGRFGLFGDDARYRLRLLGYGFFLGYASAHQLTPQTKLDSEGLVETRWRAALEGDIAHRFGTVRLGTVVLGDNHGVPASLSLDVAALYHVGDRFLGPIGEHLLVGPFFSYRVNFSRISDFGRDAYSAGIQLNVQFTDDPEVNRRRP